MEKENCYFYVEAERGGFGNNYPSFCSHPDNKDIPLGEDLPCEECQYYISHPDIFNLIVEATRTKPSSQRIQSIEIIMRGE